MGALFMSPGSLSKNFPPEVTETVLCCQLFINGQGSILSDDNNQGLLSGISQGLGNGKIFQIRPH